MLNRITLIGRVATHPELKYTPNGVAVCAFRLAVDRPYNGHERQADFFTVKVWRQRAETVANHSHKGMLMAVDGRMESWTAIQPDGTKKTGWQVNAETAEFLERMPAVETEKEQDPFGDM